MVAGRAKYLKATKHSHEQLEFSGVVSIEEMSKKRGADVQLSKDSVVHASDDEEPEQPSAQFSQSGIPLASQEELSKRKCVSASISRACVALLFCRGVMSVVPLALLAVWILGIWLQDRQAGWSEASRSACEWS